MALARSASPGAAASRDPSRAPVNALARRPATSGTGSPPNDGGARRRNLDAWPTRWPAGPRLAPSSEARRPTTRHLSASSRSGVPARGRYYVEIARAPTVDPRRPGAMADRGDARSHRGRCRRRRAGPCSSGHAYRAGRAAGAVRRRPDGRARTAPIGDAHGSRAAGLDRADAQLDGRRAHRAVRGAKRPSSRHSRRRGRRAARRSRHHRRRHRDVPFFGAPSPLPSGPALLAMETGITPYAFGVWRDATGIYHVSVRGGGHSAEGTRRARVTAAIRAEAGALERGDRGRARAVVAVFQPIWPDLDPRRAAACRRARGPGGGRR